MITAIVSPYSFSGSILKLEKVIEFSKENDVKSLMLCDANFHAVIKFINLCQKSGIKPIISYLYNDKVYYAKNTEELYELFNAYNKNDYSSLTLEYIPKDDVYFAYYFPGQRYLYEIFSKFLGTTPVEKGVLKNVYCNLEVSNYKIKSFQTLPSAPRNFLEFKNIKNPQYKQRLQKEISLIKEKNFTDYFYTVYKIVKIAKENNIKIGPGRGSAVGSLVSYFLGITKIDPIKYNLLFERFLTKGRKEPPDIDLDVEDVNRKLLIKKLKEKFKYVYHISTFSNIGKKTLKKLAYENKIKTDKISYLLDLPIHKSVHAAGIIISTSPLKAPIKDDVLEWDMESLNDIGYIKFDILGLKTLTVLSELEKQLGTPSLNDKKTFYFISKGYTNGVFQLDSKIGKKVTRLIKPSNIKELSIVLSLNRPGPLKAEIDKKYAQAKWTNKKGFSFLEDTNGVLIFQEQIMKIATELANFSEEEADILRKSVAKKDKELMEPLLSKLKENLSKKFEINKTNELINTIVEFAEYAFNKSHAVAYSHISYYLSYFKTHFPKQFYKTILKYDSTKKEKLILEMQARGFNIKFPSLDKKTDIEDKKTIILPLYLIKGINESIEKKIIQNRPYNSLEDFFNKNPEINYSIIESLIKAGLFDYLSDSRRKLLINLKELRSGINPQIMELSSILFGKKVENENYKIEKAWERCDMEYTTLGFCLSKPTENFENKLAPLSIVISRDQKLATNIYVTGGYATDGLSTIKLNIPDGIYTVIYDNEPLFFTGTRSVIYQVEKLNSKFDIEKANELETIYIKNKKLKIKKSRPVIDEYKTYIEGEKNVY